MVGYIYGIINKLNGNIYIGQTVNVKNRKYEHFHALENNNHVNEHLQNAYNFYGKENFEFAVIEKVDQKQLTLKEQYYIDYYRSVGKVYNIKLNVTNSRYGKKNKKMLTNDISLYFIFLAVITFFVYLFNEVFSKLKIPKKFYKISFVFIFILITLWTFSYFGVI